MSIDTHSHCSFSADASVDPEIMIKKAIEKNVEYYAITDHCDKDYLTANVKPVAQLDIEAHFIELSRLKAKYIDRIKVGVGIEIGYSELANPENIKVVAGHDYDYIINSVHVVDGQDAYFGDYFDGKTKQSAYSSYLNTIRESLDAPYRYETIAHIGYCTRYAPYSDPYMRYDETPEILDDILQTIIKKDKILEVNTNIKSTQTHILPNIDIVKRYRQLGGKLIAYGSDAHVPDRICDKYDLVTKLLKEVGYTEIAYYHEKKIQFYKI